MRTDTITGSTRGPARAARAHGPGPARRTETDVPPTRASLRTQKTSRAGRVRDAVVTVLAVLGVAAVVWVAVSWIFGLSVIVFVTGSMSPALPTGSAAVVRTVAASDLAVGDIVTVPRPETGNPVTHRIVGIDAVAGDAAARSLTLQGDANTIVDADRYVVSEARRLLVGMPSAGWVVIAMKSPIAMVALSLLLAGAIAWALWPIGPTRPVAPPSSS